MYPSKHITNHYTYNLTGLFDKKSEDMDMWGSEASLTIHAISMHIYCEHENANT